MIERIAGRAPEIFGASLVAIILPVLILAAREYRTHSDLFTEMKKAAGISTSSIRCEDIGKWEGIYKKAGAPYNPERVYPWGDLSINHLKKYLDLKHQESIGPPKTF